jgi:hypothetical protein
MNEGAHQEGDEVDIPLLAGKPGNQRANAPAQAPLYHLPANATAAEFTMFLMNNVPEHLHSEYLATYRARQNRLAAEASGGMFTSLLDISTL